MLTCPHISIGTQPHLSRMTFQYNFWPVSFLVCDLFINFIDFHKLLNGVQKLFGQMKQDTKHIHTQIGAKFVIWLTCKNL
jgi:hypothetical protein